MEPQEEKVLTQEMKDKITALVAAGTSIEQVQKELGVSIDALKEMFKKERHDRLLRKAEKISEEVMDLDLNDPKIEQKFGKIKIDILKERRKEAEYIRSTLGKDQGYSSRSEITGKNGEEIRIKEIIFSPPIPPNGK